MSLLISFEVTQVCIILALLFLSYVQLVLLFPNRRKLRFIPSPPVHSYWIGNYNRIVREPPGAPFKEWSRLYGGVYKVRGFFGQERLCIIDPLALRHILMGNWQTWIKPDEVRGNLSRNLGKGILVAEGEAHSRQKRLMTPAFSPQALQELVPTFFASANKLKDRWTQLIERSDSMTSRFPSTGHTPEPHQEGCRAKKEVTLDVLKWLNRLTLDTLGLAGFGYDFEALSLNSQSDIAESFEALLRGGGTIQKHVPITQFMVNQFLGYMGSIFPSLDVNKVLPNKRVRLIHKFTQALGNEAQKIIESRGTRVGEDRTSLGCGTLLDLLLKSNAGNAKVTLSDAELRGQITTFLLAGNETTSTTLAWLLYHLSTRPEQQSRVRAEIKAAFLTASADERDYLSMEEINSLSYLDAVCREVLRLEPPVSLATLVATQDDIIPLGKPVRGTDGKLISSIEVNKGQVVVIPIEAVNTNPDIFGENADEFYPERWLNQTGEEGAITGNVGVYSNILTFMTGPRACIGYRFALLEMKVIAAVLLDAFTFAPCDLHGVTPEMSRRSLIVTRPLVVDEEHLGHCMPLRVGLVLSGDEKGT